MSDPALDASAASLPFGAAPRRVSHAASVPREHVIDAMRGFAALLVAYFHCRQVTWIGMQTFHATAGRMLNFNTLLAYLTFPIAWGSAGVPIFFVISGYCIHRGAAQRLAGNPDYRLDATNFWARRFARIYPVLLAALVLTLALDWTSFHLPPVNHKLLDIGPRAFLVNLFALQGVAGKTYGSNGALWTLSIELQFYVIYPLLFALRRRIGMMPLLVLIALVNVVSGFMLEPHEIQFFTSYWFSWTLGAWIAEARVAGEPHARSSSAWFYLIAFVLMALGCIAFHFSQYVAFQLWAFGFASYLYKALDPTRPNNPIHAPIARLLSRVGDFSFSLYLIHLPIFVLLSSLLFRSSLQTQIWPSFAFMLVAVPLARVFYRLVELPAMKWSASLKRKPRTQAKAAHP